MEAMGAIVLTGGASRRMGSDKATLALGGVTLAERTAGLLSGLVALAVEVGAGVSGLASVREDPPGGGPLAAIVAGHRALLGSGLVPWCACLVLACDLPLLDRAVLARLCAGPAGRSVLPVIGGLAQPLCARWSSDDLVAASAAFAGGERSLHHLPDRGRALLLDEAVWGEEAARFSDVDTPADLMRLGLAIPGDTP